MPPRRQNRNRPQQRDPRRMTPKERATRLEAADDRYLDTFGFPAYQAQQAYEKWSALYGEDSPQAQAWVPFLNPKLAARYAEWAGVGVEDGTRPDSDIVRPGEVGPIGGAPGPAIRRGNWKPSWQPDWKPGGGGRPGGGRPGGGNKGGGKQGGGKKGGGQQGGQQGGKLQNAAENLLGGLGVPGDYRKLIRKAVIQGWSLDEFANALMRTPAFRQAFPGLINNGQLEIGFTNGLTAGAEALMQAVANYRSGYEDFTNTASAAGYSGKLDKNTFALAIRSGTSPEEFASRIQLVNTMNANPGLLDMVNEQRTYAGLTPFSTEMDLLKAAARNDPDFVDNYQAAWLRSQGLNIDAAAAGRLAMGIDSPLGPQADLGQLVAEVRRVRGQIGPELDAAGFNDEYLAGLAAGLDPGNKAGQLQQILSQQQARSQMASQRSPRSQGQRSSSGGFSLFGEDEPRSY